MSKPKAAEFAKWLGECADRHDGYIMGAVGQDPKELHEWYFNQYKDRSQYSAKQEAQALKWKETAKRVFDCQGLADCYVTEQTGVKVNVRARDNYTSWCGVKSSGDIPADRRVPGAAVFMESSYIHHVGYLEKPVIEHNPQGDWYIVEAQGVLQGVVRTKLSQRGWDKWGWMTEKFEYDLAPDDSATEYGGRTLKRGMTGEDVRALQRDLISLNYGCSACGMSGEFNEATESAVEAFQLNYRLEVDGIAGPETFGKLDELLQENGEETEASEPISLVQIVNGKTWNVRTQPSAKAAIVGIAKRGILYEANGMTASGWVGIIYNGEPAWVSEKAVRA